MSEGLTSLQRRLVIPFVGLARGYKTVAVTGFNLGLIFLLCNFGAHAWLKHTEKPSPDPGRHFARPGGLLTSNPELVARLYPGLTALQVQQRLHPGGVVSHPVLEFMQRPQRGPAYNVGTENLRATGFVAADTATTTLNGAHWVFGGSTVFGHGVADNETLVHHLDRLHEGEPWINFGVQGYDQNIEISKLILLLKKGYRPRSVVFVDGLNDIFGRLGSNYAPEESPMLPFSAYSYVYNVKALEGAGTLKRWLHAFPLVKLARHIAAQGAAPSRSISEGPTAIYEPDSRYHQDPRLHFAKTPATYADKEANLDAYAARLIAFYEANLNQLAHLSHSYGFDIWVVYQPNGLLRPDSDFVVDADAYVQSVEFRVLNGLHLAVRRAIAAGPLAVMVDLADADQGQKSAYVDLAHYSDAFNAEFARRILEIRAQRPPLPLPGR